jgi:hypothetical protein
MMLKVIMLPLPLLVGEQIPTEWKQVIIFPPPLPVGKQKPTEWNAVIIPRPLPEGKQTPAEHIMCTTILGWFFPPLCRTLVNRGFQTWPALFLVINQHKR